MDEPDGTQGPTAYAVSEGALDGNVLAGPLGEVMGVDVTAAIVVCAGCGRRQAVAELVVFASAMGSVARCRGCGDVMLRVVEVRSEVRSEVLLDLRGCSVLRLSV